jgi:anti-sigma regulatory factor (Ser/Thr protein kinase)
MEVGTSAVVLLPYTPSSVAVARRCLTADLVSAGIFESAVGDAALVISELLSNAIRHAAPLPGSQIRVAWTLGGDALRVAVSDAGGGPLPRAARPSPAAASGRGLGIVETLSSRWGVLRDGGETTVWAVLAAPHVTGSVPGAPPVSAPGSAPAPAAIAVTGLAPGPPAAAPHPAPQPERSAADA